MTDLEWKDQPDPRLRMAALAHRVATLATANDHQTQIQRLQAENAAAFGIEPPQTDDQARSDRRALVMHMMSFARLYSAFDLDVLHEAAQKDLQDVDSLAVTP